MKSVMKLVAKLAVLLLPFPLAVFVGLSRFPMQLFDSEYAYYYQNKEYAAHHDQYCRVLVLGDSVTKSAVHPDLLSEDTHNFALGGGFIN